MTIMIMKIMIRVIKPMLSIMITLIAMLTLVQLSDTTANNYHHHYYFIIITIILIIIAVVIVFL